MAKYAGPDESADTAGIVPLRNERRFSVRRMARLLNVSTSGYYAHAKRAAATVLAPRRQRRADLEVKITQAHKDSDGTYGSRPGRGGDGEDGCQDHGLDRVGGHQSAHVQRCARRWSIRPRRSRRTWSTGTAIRGRRSIEELEGCW